MSIAGQLVREATDLAAQTTYQVPNLEAEKLRIETRLHEIEAQLHAANLALDRLNRFVPLRGADLQCPRCWVASETASTLIARDGGTMRQDFYRCRICGHEMALQV